MLSRGLSRATFSKSRLALASRTFVLQRRLLCKPPDQTIIDVAGHKSLSEGDTSTDAVENVELTFVEEPLGLRADQGFGYLQVDFGQRIGPGDRYEVLRKLGWGMNASVWLARDHEEECYVAIKALKGMATDIHFQGYMQELPIMECVTEHIQQSGRPAYCATLRSHFIHHGKPNDGEHLCLVMDVLAGDIEALQTESKAFPVPLAKRILRDTLRGLAQLHASGCVHTDLKSANIMCNLPEATSEANLRLLLESSPSRRHPPEQSWDYFVEAAVSQPLPPPSIDQALSASFVIGDFGSAQFVDHQVISHITPDTLRAPESILQGPWDSKVDIWTFGCLVYEFMLGIPLFPRKHPEFSPNLIKTYKYAPDFLDMETGYLARVRKPVTKVHFSLLFRRNAGVLALPEHDIAGAIDLMSRCFRIDPADRPTAIELVRESPWMLELGDDF
ncbi:kinase-like domain-containing protein [Sparassis latifolia]